MKKIALKIVFGLRILGFDPVKFVSVLKGISFYIKDYRKIKKLTKHNKDFTLGRLYPILDERFSDSGTMSGHYFHQDLIIAQKIYNNKPIRHIDIGSRIDGFVAHVAAFREVEIFDIRPLVSSVKNITFTQADLMKLPDSMIACCDSLSSLHVIEHFGLGRYGDPIDIDGHLKAIDNIYLMLKPEGKFYFATPIGKHQRIEFNAHRVFSVEYLLKHLQDKFKIDSFSYVDDKGDLHSDVILSKETSHSSFNCNYGCGIFELTKK